MKKLLLLSLLSTPMFAQSPAHSVVLSWSAPVDAVATSTVRIYRAAGDCSGTPAYVKIADNLPVDKSYTDSTVGVGAYCYAATQVQNSAESVKSNTAIATVSPLPVLNLTITVK